MLKLASRATDYKDLSNFVSVQHNQLTTLTKANEGFKDQNRKLQIEVLNSQKDLLWLKVDFIGIPKSPYETYDQLRNKITEVMMPTCDGRDDEVK